MLSISGGQHKSQPAIVIGFVAPIGRRTAFRPGQAVWNAMFALQAAAPAGHGERSENLRKSRRGAAGIDHLQVHALLTGYALYNRLPGTRVVARERASIKIQSHRPLPTP